MIHGELTSLTESLNPNIRGFFTEFLDSIDITTDVGRYQIIDGEIFANVNDTFLKARNESRIEAHRVYCDIHIMLSGTEKIDIYTTSDLVPSIAYNTDEDIEFFQEPNMPPAVTITNNVGEFTIVWPDDAHRPTYSDYEPYSRVKKIVIKIKPQYLSKGSL